MFVSFFLPTNVDHSQLEFVMFQQMNRFQKDDIHFIAPEFYFLNPLERPESCHFQSKDYQKNRKFTVPSYRDIQAVSKTVMDSDLFSQLRKNLLTEARVHAFLQETEHPEFTEWLFNELTEIQQRSSNGIEAILTWRDCKSLKKAAQQLNIPIIHNEYGHHREPDHEDTIYFDFEGTKESTEALRRYESIKGNPEIENILVEFSNRFLRVTSNSSQGKKVGLLLGVEAEKGFTNNLTYGDLITIARKITTKNNVIIRPHPWGEKVTYEEFEYDYSRNLEYLAKECYRVITIYSNAGVELMARGLQVDYLGPTPLAFLSGITCREEVKKKLGFYMLAYLTPGRFLFDPDYYRWRLSRPSEVDIIDLHLKEWKSLKAKEADRLF